MVGTGVIWGSSTAPEKKFIFNTAEPSKIIEDTLRGGGGGGMQLPYRRRN